MAEQIKRIAINFGGGYAPGLNAVITGVVLAAHELAWETVGIRDGFDGLLFPERYPEGGLIELTLKTIENLAGTNGCILGTSPQTDPFNVRAVTPDGMVEEVDRSDDLLASLKEARIDAVISVTGSRALGVLLKLNRKGLRTVCIPKSLENDVAATMLSFGFNSTLSFITELLGRALQAAQSTRQIAVVEVPGVHAGWLALQAGMAVCADAVLIPEIHYDPDRIAAKLNEKMKDGRSYGLVVVAEGAEPIANGNGHSNGHNSEFKSSLSPGASGKESLNVIERSGRSANDVALAVQRLTHQQTYPVVLSKLAGGGVPTVVDRQLGLGYGVGAVRALQNGESGVMVVFQPPDVKLVPLTDAINKVRTVPANSEMIQLARAMGIAFGD
jgi:6-phosphofructokinase 1